VPAGKCSQLGTHAGQGGRQCPSGRPEECMRVCLSCELFFQAVSRKVFTAWHSCSTGWEAMPFRKACGVRARVLIMCVVFSSSQQEGAHSLALTQDRVGGNALQEGLRSACACAYHVSCFFKQSAGRCSQLGTHAGQGGRQCPSGRPVCRSHM